MTSCLITTPVDAEPRSGVCSGDGPSFGVSISYAVQTESRWTCSGHSSSAVIMSGKRVLSLFFLGDNIFYGPGLGTQSSAFSTSRRRHHLCVQGRGPVSMASLSSTTNGAQIFVWKRNRSRPRCEYAVPGFYFYDNDVIEDRRRPSSRPTEAIMRSLMSIAPIWTRTGYRFQVLPRGTAWLDTGTFDSLLDAANYVRTIEEHQGLKIGVPEEVAWRLGYCHRRRVAGARRTPGQIRLRRLLS